MDSEQKVGKAANEGGKRLKVQPKRWPKKRMERGYKKWKRRQKRAVQKDKKWGKVDSELREEMAAKSKQGSQPRQKLSE